MAKSAFVHLHNHSEYSLLDGACRIADMVDWAYQTSAPAVALTDHGNMFGAWDFYKTAKDKGVNPIVGCEVYVAPGSRHERGKTQGSPYHLTLLSEDATGYKNLMKLVSLGYTEGFYSKPRIDMEILREYREGIIALTGCIQGFVPALLASDQRDQGVKNFLLLQEIMGKDNLYVEVQHHGIPEEERAYPIMVQLAQEYNLPIVGTNDCHYLRKSDHRMHDVLLCIQMKRAVSEENRMRFLNQFYFKSIDEMHAALVDFPPEAITNTLEIANRCRLELNYGEHIMPKYEVPDGYTADSYLAMLCYDGLREKYGEISTEMQERLDYELDIIEKTGYAGYLLIVWDYVNFARERGFPLNARGSAGGSLALLALGVTTFNPMEYDCMFERFLNLDRISMPDIDIDFGDEHRKIVIDYLTDKYGSECVGQVATFSTFAAKAAVTDVGRALDVPVQDVRRVTQLIPTIPGVTLDESLEEVPQFREVAEAPENRDMMDVAKSIEGMKRHVSIHACGVVLANGPLTDYVPLFKDKHDRIATQFDLKMLEDVGMVKFDFLGLRTLSEVYDCLARIKENHGVELTLEEISFDDEKTYELISHGLVAGLFQLETSPGMRRVIMQIKPNTFEDFIPIPALYRPGPLDSGMMDSFIRRKLKIEKVTYLHPTLENALKNTYGVCIYQEQVMQIARDMALFTLGEADVLRDAMGKKKMDVLKMQREKFIHGATKNGIKAEVAEEIFDYLEPFGRYAFNRSHTVAYAILSYQMAYLKTHYPREFMASMLTGESGDSNKIMKYRAECRKLSEFLDTNIEVLPPDINSSETDFTVVGDDIRFGLAAVKNVSETAIEVIVQEREKDGSFKSLQDFCERVDTKAVNKRSIESLIMAGAFDSLDGHRAQYMASLEQVLKTAQSSQKDREKGQMSLFGAADEEAPIIQVELAEVPEWSYDERLRNEKEQLGFYLSGNPLQQYEDLMKYYATATSQTLAENSNGTEVYVVGLIASVRLTKTKKGDPMAILVIEDLEGGIDVVVFPEAYKGSRSAIEEGSVVWLRGNVDEGRKKNGGNGDEIEEDIRQIQAEEIVPIDQVIDRLTSAVEISIPEADIDNLDKIHELQQVCLQHRGEYDLILRFTAPKYGEVIAQSSSRYNLSYDDEVISEIEALFGSNCVKTSNRTMRVGERSQPSMSFV
ncbi:MAG: DNA polymerase III subunit alpha [Candidatus Poribacteria bacterium]|nr:DNA polymerase III subunit alpha [Candidatus Poribacteria bacterium]